MSDPAILTLRVLSLAEGISYLVLLYFSIYHKRILGEADAIRVPGMIHGILFVLFCLVLCHVWLERKWPLRKAAFAFACSLLPFAPFYLERRLKAESREKTDPNH